MTLIADLFMKLRTPKNVARYMSKKSRFKGPFDLQHGKRVQTLLRSTVTIFSDHPVTRKKSVLDRCKASEVFVNTLTVTSILFLIETI